MAGRLSDGNAARIIVANHVAPVAEVNVIEPGRANRSDFARCRRKLRC